MTVINIVTTALRIINKGRSIGRQYKYLDINKKMIRKYAPPQYRRPLEIGSDILISGGLIYQATDLVYNALQKNGPYSFRQTRSKLGKSGTKRFGYSNYRTRYRRPCKCKKPQY